MPRRGPDRLSRIGKTRRNETDAHVHARTHAHMYASADDTRFTVCSRRGGNPHPHAIARSATIKNLFTLMLAAR